MFWIGKGVLKFGDQIIKNGEKIPRNFNKQRLNRLKKRKLIGDIVKPAEPEQEPAK